jgi:hypothetical protein
MTRHVTGNPSIRRMPSCSKCSSVRTSTSTVLLPAPLLLLLPGPLLLLLLPDVLPLPPPLLLLVLLGRLRAPASSCCARASTSSCTCIGWAHKRRVRLDMRHVTGQGQACVQTRRVRVGGQGRRLLHSGTAQVMSNCRVRHPPTMPGCDITKTEAH